MAIASLMENPKQPIRTIVIPCPGMVEEQSTNIRSVNDPTIARALTYIEKHFRETIDVSDVVKNLGCCRRTLERRFSSILGITIHQYLLDHRLNFAKICMARQLPDKLDVIAQLCGFGDSKTFRNAFLRSTGQTPSQWRQMRLRKLNNY
jgi:transcriptional regulator GlxA family with amidase domain